MAAGRSLFLVLLVVAGGCVTDAGRAPNAVSDRGERICRERQADLPPGTTAMKARGVYVECLRTIDREMASRAAATSPDTTEPVRLASAEQRYLHCRLRSEEIAKAYDAYTRSTSLWAYADSVYPDDDPRYQTARQAHRQAVAEVERLIPPAMRGGEPLFPDALNRFRRCEREAFR
ncbi:hypothetical protein NZK32_16580 [Cyanobium sp. FGCU-52]|nr:hypothetical protein [Cyanobium sp. FGCU52]